jgi:hypothetical protein
MPMRTFPFVLLSPTLFWLLFGLLGLALAVPPVQAEEALARAVLVRGEVFRGNAAGVRQTLKKDDPVRVGDSIETGVRGLAQIVFPDQSILYVQAASQVRIEAFHFQPQDPSQDRSITNLLKGGMRAVTGALGGRSPDQLEIRAGVSTLGIRGTALELAEMAPGEWRITFDYGRGWVANPAGRADVETGQSLRLLPDRSPIPYRYRRLPGDPVELARSLVGMTPAGAETWMQGRAAGLPQEDLFFTLGLLREVPGFTPEHLLGVLAGASRALPLERRGELAGFAARVYPQQAPQILKSGAVDAESLPAVLRSILRGLEGAPPGLLEAVLQQALELGLSKAQAEALLKELRENPLVCE